MGQSKYVIGVDFGTLSGRMVIVDTTDGREVTTAVYEYRNGVIDEVLPGTGIRLERIGLCRNPTTISKCLREQIQGS